MEDHTTTDSTLAILRELRKDFPETGAVLQAALRRTESDCRALAHEGPGPAVQGRLPRAEAVAFQDRLDIDPLPTCAASRSCSPARATPMIATHDPRMVEIASSLASHGQAQGSYEFQMLYGIRPEEQRRLVAEGETVRVYVPYGHEWYGYLMRRLAGRPQNLTFFLRSLISKSWPTGRHAWPRPRSSAPG